MLLVSSVLAVAAALIHLVLFVRENPAWAGRIGGTNKTTTPAEHEGQERKGLDQSYFDLFLAIGVLVGVVLLNMGGGARLDIMNPNNYVEKNGAYGVAAITFGLACMLATSVALTVSKRAPLQDLAIRGLIPAAGLISIVLMRSELAGI